MKYKNSVRSILLRGYKRVINTPKEFNVSDIKHAKEQIKLLEGKEEIKWKPKIGSKYYHPIVVINEADICALTNDDIDKFRLKHNLVFKTQKEAKKRLNKILEKL